MGISERPKAVRRAELRSKPFNTEVVEEEEEEEEEGKEEAITDANGRSMATGMSAADVWVSCEAIAAGGWRTVLSLLITEEEGASTGGGETSTTGSGSLGLFGFWFCEVKLARGRSEPGTE